MILKIQIERQSVVDMHQYTIIIQEIFLMECLGFIKGMIMLRKEEMIFQRLFQKMQ